MTTKYNMARLICLVGGGISFCYNFFPEIEDVTGVIGMILLIFILLLGSKSIRTRFWANLDLCCCIMYILLFAVDVNSPIVQYVDRIFFAGLSVLIFFTIRSYKVETEKLMFPSNYFWGLVQFGLAFVVAFQFSGYQTFYGDSGRCHLEVSGLLSFGLFIWWSIELIGASEILFEELRKRGREESVILDRKQIVRMMAVVFGIIFVIGIAMSVIYYPGIFSYDVVTCYQEAIDIGDPSTRRDAHSFLYVLLLSVFTKFGRNCYPVTFLFIVAYSLVNTAFLIYLYKMGIKKNWIFVIVAFLSVFPVNMFMMTALWKDIPFTISLISLTHALCKMAVQGQEFVKSKINIAHLFLVLIFTALFRSNGMAAIAGTLVVVFILCIRDYKYLRGFLVVTVSAAIVFIIKVPVYNMLQVDGTPESMACQPFNDGIWQNIYIGNELSQDTEEYMYGIMPRQDWIDNYRSYYHNSFAFADQYGELELGRSIRGWLDCLKKYPLDTIGARFLKTDMIWSVYKNEGARLSYNVVFDASEVNLEEKFGWDWLEQTQGARVLFSEYFDFFDKNFAVLYRGGWNLVILLLIIWNSVRYCNKKAILALVPGFSSTLALLFASCFCDYRYIWYMFLLTPFYVCNYVVQNRRATDCGIGRELA